ncbi:rhomboid family intramembrane serine protease [Parabacteroides sp. PF5-6]|uniref:rhomboid family intramembrane serine protease n=1 Tax=Parabacteroides sp. PF5-6 TaxID=1742403 RepID=UPI002404B4E9|nr:rhomboid family intramembrane serine protease [Parabacteroides sp. PF5-6]MDF9829634.1 membrane associated rhomboid family serine protease [Parabacteroides sp. PF5-6]
MITYILIGLTLLVSFQCFSKPRLFYALAFVPYRMLRRQEWWRLVTHGFVHADSMHLLVNMFTFWSFGTYIERSFGYLGLGPAAYLGLYLGGMVAASLFDTVKYRNDPNYVSIGASGAVSAVLFTSILFDPFGKILLFAVLPIPGILFGVFYLVYCQYMAKKGGDNINHNAHFYGAVYGFFYPIVFHPELGRGFLAHFF